MTQSRVGARLNWSAKKVYRLEAGESPVTREDAEALAGIYGLDPARTTELLDLVEAASGPAWWSSYRRVVSPEFGLYLSFERAAEQLFCFHPTLVAGLIQTEQYAHSILSATSTPLDLPQRVRLRRARRDLLARSRPPRITILLGEAALHNQVGSPEIMREQLRHLQSEATAGEVELGVVPFDRCAYPAMLLGFDLAQLSDGEIALSLELPPVSRTTHAETVLNDLFMNYFAQIRGRALFGADAASLIDATREERARSNRDHTPT